jgi:hypothetical protein
VDKPVELVPLVCIKCATPVEANLDEVAWVCTQCGQGLALDETRGLGVQEINFSKDLAPTATGSPYWVAPGTVTLKRTAYDNSGSSDREAQNFWGQSRIFFIPAFTCPIEMVIGNCLRYLAQSPVLQAGPAVRFAPVTMQAMDMQPLAEFILMAVESGRKDKLRHVQFTLTLGVPALWILP